MSHVSILVAGCPDDHLSMRGAALLEFYADGKLEDRLDAPIVEERLILKDSLQDGCEAIVDVQGQQTVTVPEAFCFGTPFQHSPM